MNNPKNEKSREAESASQDMTAGELSNALRGAMRQIRLKLDAEKAAAKANTGTDSVRHAGESESG